jgi:hypothetical protein
MSTPPPAPQFVQPYGPGPAPVGGGPRQRARPALMVVALAASGIAVVMSGFALVRGPTPAASPPQVASGASSAPVEPSPASAEVAAARKEACDAWAAAGPAAMASRQAFADLPNGFSWSDPNVSALLTQAEAGVLTQMEYLRLHTRAATPAEVAGPIQDYVAAAIDLVALDGQHASAAVANAAADRVTEAMNKIRAACGLPR